MQTLMTLFAVQLTLMLMLSLWLATIIKIILHAKQTCRNRSGMLTHTLVLCLHIPSIRSRMAQTCYIDSSGQLQNYLCMAFSAGNTLRD